MSRSPEARAAAVERTRQWRLQNPDRYLEQSRARFAARKEELAQYKRDRRATRLAEFQEKEREYRSRPQTKALRKGFEAGFDARYPGRRAEIKLEYLRRNPHMAGRRRTRQATPPWLTADELHQMRALYAEAKRRGLTVDHIHPLNGKKLSGLHVPWNLQLLTRAENSRKRNNFEPETTHHG